MVLYLLASSLPAQTLQPDTSYTPYQTWLKIRKNYPDVSIVQLAHYPSVIEKYDLVHATLTDTYNTKRELHLDIFSPTKKGKYPALIMIHGGG